jgi:hypothetical protein
MSGPSYSGSASFFNDSTTASGISAANHPGIAVDNSSTMKGYWLLKAPGGKQYVTQQIDWGPNPSLVAQDRPIDLSEPLATAIGFDKNAGVSPGYSVTFLGHSINDVAGALGKHPGDLGQLASTGLQSLDGATVSTGAPSPSGAQPAGSPAGLTASTSFDQAAYNQARQRYVLGSYLGNEAKDNPWETKVPGEVPTSNPVLDSGLATTSPPNPADYTSTTYKLAQNTLQGLAGNTPLDTHPSSAAGYKGYVNPIPGFNIGRTDQGVDASAAPGTPIKAIGDSKLVETTGDWYAGQPLMLFQFLNGPKAGQYWYVSEQISPTTMNIGTVFHTGDTVAKFASSGTGIEIGWGSPAASSGGHFTLAVQQGNTGDSSHNNAPAGVDFRNFLNSVGGH